MCEKSSTRTKDVFKHFWYFHFHTNLWTFHAFTYMHLQCGRFCVLDGERFVMQEILYAWQVRDYKYLGGTIPKNWVFGEAFKWDTCKNTH